MRGKETILGLIQSSFCGLSSPRVLSPFSAIRTIFFAARGHRLAETLLVFLFRAAIRTSGTRNCIAPVPLICNNPLYHHPFLCAVFSSRRGNYRVAVTKLGTRFPFLVLASFFVESYRHRQGTV